MSKENVLLILWIIFGFIFISAIDSLLYLAISLVYLAELEANLSNDVILYSVCVFTFLAYILTTLILVRHLRFNSNSEGIYLKKFPINWFIIFTIITFSVKPLSSKLKSIYAEKVTSLNEVKDFSEYILTYGWINTTISLSQLLTIIILAVIFIRKYKTLNR